MIIEKNGIKLSVSLTDDALKYKVMDQTVHATNVIKLIGGVKDEITGFSLRSNRYPAWGPKNKVFFIRGLESAKNNTEVIIPFGDKFDRAKAERAIEAIDRMLDKVVAPAGIEKLDHKKENTAFKNGGTSHVRTAIITKGMADELKLTGKHHYPNERSWPGNIKPVVTNNFHYSDHISQAVDVLNKAASSTYKNPKEKDEGIVGANLHRVTHQQGRRAVEALKGAFDYAQQDGYLVALWRLATGLRSSDACEDPFVVTSKQQEECIEIISRDIKKMHPTATFTGNFSLCLDKANSIEVIIKADFKVGNEIKTCQRSFEIN